MPVSLIGCWFVQAQIASWPPWVKTFHCVRMKRKSISFFFFYGATGKSNDRSTNFRRFLALPNSISSCWSAFRSHSARLSSRVTYDQEENAETFSLFAQRPNIFLKNARANWRRSKRSTHLCASEWGSLKPQFAHKQILIWPHLRFVGYTLLSVAHLCNGARK